MSLFLRLEGNLFKYTNVMRGFQMRYFVVNTMMSKLDYFVVSKKLIKTLINSKS